MILPFALLVLMLGSGLLPGKDYRFSLNDREFDPRILPVVGTRKGDYKPGDIGRVGNFPFVLSSPGHYQFHVGGHGDTKLFCRIDEGPTHCVGVYVTSPRTAAGRSPSLINPLHEMTPLERSQLWGIRVDMEPSAWHAILHTTGLEWNRTALRLEYTYNGKSQRVLPALPTDLCYLILSCEGVTGLNKLTGLRANKKLRFLDLQLYDQTIDLSSIFPNPGLVNLSISGGSLESIDQLAKLSAIKFLKLRGTGNLNSVSFVSSMPELRVFKVDSTNVTDLRLLSSCPQLRLLSASDTAAERLPDGRTLPHLRDVRLLDTPAAGRREEVEMLRRTSPACAVQASWEEALRARLARANRLSISACSFHLLPERNRDFLVEITDLQEVQQVISQMRINPRNSGSYCMSNGDFQLYFHEGDKLVATLGLHQGRFLRWHRGRWPGDAELSIPAARILCDLLASTGQEQPRKDLRQAIAVKRARVKNWDPSIRSFEKADQESRPRARTLLLTGSSSIRKWDLQKSFPGKQMINRGFGGSELSDAILYFDRIVLPHDPRVVFLYAGDNDIERGKSAQQVVEDYKAYSQLIREKAPNTRFAFISIKPSLKRWHLWPEMALANRMIESICETDNYSYYIDIVGPMLDSEGLLRENLFAGDGLHLSEKGYHEWTRVISQWLDQNDPGP